MAWKLSGESTFNLGHSAPQDQGTCAATSASAAIQIACPTPDAGRRWLWVAKRPPMARSASHPSSTSSPSQIGPKRPLRELKLDRAGSWHMIVR